MGTMASRITSLTIVYSTVYSGADQRKHQRSASLASVSLIQRWPVNFPHKGPVTRKNASIWWWRHHIDQTPYYSSRSPRSHKICRLLINSLTPDRLEWNFRYAIFKLILVIGAWGKCSKIALRWILLDLTDEKSTLVQVMSWCRLATSPYLRQQAIHPNLCQTRPQWVNT